MANYLPVYDEARRLVLQQSDSPVAPPVPLDVNVADPDPSTLGELPDVSAPPATPSMTGPGTLVQMPHVPVDFAEINSLKAPQIVHRYLDPASTAVAQAITPTTEPKSPDYTAMLRDAKDQSERDRALSMMLRGSSTIAGALTRTKPDTSTADEMEKLGAGRLGEVKQTVELDELSRKAREAAEMRDPNSAFNQRFRMGMANSAFAKAMGPAFNSLTYDQFVKISPQIKDFATIDENNRRLEQDAYKNQTDLALRKQEAITHRMTAERPIVMPGMSGAIDDRANQNNLINLGKDDATKFSQMIQSLRNLENVVPGITSGQMPKDFDVSLGDRAVAAIPVAGSYLATDKALALQHAQEGFLDLLERARSGAVINKDEQAMYKKMFGTGPITDLRGFANAIHQIKALMYNQLRARQNPLGEGAAAPRFQVLQKYKGNTYLDPIFKDVSAEGDPKKPVPDASRTAPAAKPTADSPQQLTRTGRTGTLPDGTKVFEVSDGSWLKETK